MHKLYIEVDANIQPGKLFTTIPSFISLYILKYLKWPTNIEPIFVQSSLNIKKGVLQLCVANLSHIKFISPLETTKYQTTDLRLPTFVKEDDTVVAGMCAVCRELVICQFNEKLKHMLGFKRGCLLAPSEISIWTRFCEVDVIEALKNLLALQAERLPIEEMPLEAVRFEHHMKEPVRMHNIHKLARNEAIWSDQQKNQTDNERESKTNKKAQIESKLSKDDLVMEHTYVEGVWFTIADLILYPCLKLLYHLCSGMLNQFPLTSCWFHKIESFDITCRTVLEELCIFLINNGTGELGGNLIIPSCQPTSLYKRNTKRYKPRHRIYTDQAELDAVLKKVQNLELDFKSDCAKTFNNKTIDWTKIEPAHVENCALPPQRLERKRQQLENMANAVASMAITGNRIIDFCSGTGHLGILLALQLPQCTIILMENKPESLHRAKERAKKLKLANVIFYQCNIDYFEGSFDLGTCLHACGTATDIVLQQCRRVKAKFVCCSCCYGALQVMPHITYPLSRRFSQVLCTKEYMYIAHAADQAHALGTLNCKEEITRQGQLCMDIIDTDRKVHAEEAAYEVQLTRLQPESCTPKNRLLVGRPILHAL